MKQPSDTSPLREQAISALQRARKLPPGPYRNDLRQIAIGLKWLERRQLDVSDERQQPSDLALQRD